MEERHAPAEVSGGQAANFQAADARVSDLISRTHGLGLLGLIAKIRSVAPYGHLTLSVLLVCAGYYLGGVIGIAPMFPDSPIAVIWPPNPILLAGGAVAHTGAVVVDIPARSHSHACTYGDSFPT